VDLVALGNLPRLFAQRHYIALQTLLALSLDGGIN
jgi:hypothetical protein